MSDPPDARRPETRFHVTGQPAPMSRRSSAGRQNASAQTPATEPLLAVGFRDIAERRDGSGSTAGTVRQPRHLVVYRLDSDVVIIDRILHDAMDLRRHLDLP